MNHRIPWTAIAVGIALLLVGTLTVINSVELSRLAEANPSGARDAQLQVIATHVADLAQEVEYARKRPEAVSLLRYDAEIETVEQRLTIIEQVLHERPADDLQPLRNDLTQLEERLTQFMARTTAPAMAPTAVPTATPPPARPSPSPKAAEPPFQLIGIERRADERFLAILPAKADSLAQMRLLRVGDKEDGWRLDAIDDETATFKAFRYSVGGLCNCHLERSAMQVRNCLQVFAVFESARGVPYALNDIVHALKNRVCQSVIEIIHDISK
jgi:hypothetical protein